MAEITPEIRALHKSWADSVPAEVLEQIDDTELRDRLDEAAALRAKATATTSLILRQGYQDRARLILKAAPRDHTEARAAEWLAKADGAATAEYRENCLAEAERIRAANPQAPRRNRRTEPAVRRPLFKATPPPVLTDPDGPVTRAWLDDFVKSEVGRVRGNLTAQAREAQLDAETVLYK